MEDSGKNIAILAYCTLIGFIIAIVMHSSNKTKLGAYHLRQALGIICLAVGLWIVNFILAMVLVGMGAYSMVGIISMIFMVGFLGILALLIMGIIAAAAEEEKPLPLIGKFFENLFKNAFS